MKRIYVAGLMSRIENGEIAHAVDYLANVRRGIRESVKILKMGYAPFSPFIDFSFFLQEHITEKEIKGYSMSWLEVCDAVYVISGEGAGSGVDAEINRAKQLSIPVFYNKEDIKEYFSK